MAINGDEIHVDVDEARAASTPNIVRWVLIISLFAAIALLTVIWVVGAWSSDQDTHSVDARIRAAESNERNNTIVGDQADRMDAAKPAESQDTQGVANEDAGQ